MRTKISLFFAVIVVCALTSCCQSNDYHAIQGFAQGGSYHVIYSDRDGNGEIITADETQVSRMVNKLLIDVDHSLSGYNPQSILSRINVGEDCPLDSIFVENFKRSAEIWTETGGKFDVSGAPLFDYWGFGFKNPEQMKRMRLHKETKSAIDSILQFVGMDKVKIVTTGYEHHLHKDDERLKLNFNAIAQGYSCDLVARGLEKMGIENYLVEVGMEIVCKGLNSRGKKWKIGIDAPEDGNIVAGKNIQEVLEVTDCGIVTSGNYRKFYIEDGVKYSHSIDPTTGYPTMDRLLSATIIAPDATTADAYATYCMVIGYEKAKAFIESRPDLKGYLIYDGGVWSKQKTQD